MPRRLRAFFRTRTLQANGGSFTQTRYDAILTKGGSPTPTYIPPHWNNPLPTFTFINGVPSSHTFSGYFVDGNGGTSTITGANLPSGVTVNSASRTLVYDGAGAIASSSTATLTADDGYEDFTAITSLVVRDTAGTAGMVFAEGDVPSNKYITSTTSGFQARVKNSWPDGSAKIAVMSWSGVTASQASPLTVSIGRTATPPTGSDLTLTTLRSIATSGSVSLGSYGSVNLATVIAGAPFRTWQFGPKCSEWHWRSQVGSDLSLVVWFYVRLFGNGRVWIRVGVENGYTFARDHTYKQQGKTYRALITLNGTLRYDSATDTNLAFPAVSYASGGTAWYGSWAAGNDIPHSSRTRWSLDFWYDGGPVRVPGHDGAYIIASKLVPNYYSTGIPQSEVDDTRWVTYIAPLMNANHRPNQQPAGSDPEIAYLPKWDAMHLLLPQGSANQDRMFRVVVANAVAAGSYSFFRDENTNLPNLWSDDPNLWSGDPGDSNTIGWYTGGTVWNLNAEHEPAWAYLAYLLTGDFYHLETEQHHAAASWINLNYVYREGVKGLIWRASIAARRFGWTIRQFIHAACVTPDKSSASGNPVEDYHYHIKALYRACIGYNCQRYLSSHRDGTYSEPGYTFDESNDFGYIVADMNYGSMAYFAGSEDAQRVGMGLPRLRGEGPWQQNFVQFTLGHACELKVVSGQDATYLGELTDFTLKMPVGMAGAGDATGWPYPFCAAGSVPFWKETGAAYSGTWVHAANWTEAYEWKIQGNLFPDIRPVAPSGGPMLDTYTYWGGGGASGGAGDPAGAVDSYFGNLYPALSYAVDRGITGATTARSRLRGMTGTTTPGGYPGDWMVNYEPLLFTIRPQWAVVPR